MTLFGRCLDLYKKFHLCIQKIQKKSSSLPAALPKWIWAEYLVKVVTCLILHKKH